MCVAFFTTDDCDVLIPERLKFVKGAVDLEVFTPNIWRETLQQNKILRVIKKNLVKNCLEMLAETAEENDDYKKFIKLFGKCLKPWETIVEQVTGVHVPQTMEDIVEVAKIVQQVSVQLRTVEEIVDVGAHLVS